MKRTGEVFPSVFYCKKDVFSTKGGKMNKNIIKSATKTTAKHTSTIEQFKLTHEMTAQIKEEFDKTRANIPAPKIAIFGATGVGKSSTVNALFNAGRQVSNIVACEDPMQAIEVEIGGYEGRTKQKIIVYDIPGIGQNIDADKRIRKIYYQLLPKVDVIIWLLQASDRAMTTMQQVLRQLKRRSGKILSKKLVVAVNKIDLLAPGAENWNSVINMPGKEQSNEIPTLIDYISKHILRVLPKWNKGVLAYSATKQYNLKMLVKAILDTIPDDNFAARALLDRFDVAKQSDFMSVEGRTAFEKLIKGGDKQHE